MGFAKSAALAAIALLLFASPSRADKLYLTNGQVREGKIVKKDATGVEFREVKGKITFIKRYATEEVLKVESGDQSTESATEAETRAESQPPSSSPSLAATRAGSKIENKPEFLRKALAKVKDKPDAALIDLTHLVRASSGQELADLSELSKKEADQPLDELLAATRVQVAIKKSSGQITKGMITDFEKTAIVAELHRTIEECRGQKVGGTTIDAEIEDPQSYKGSGKDAKDFAKQVTVTLNLVTLATELDRSARSGTGKAETAKDRRDAGKKDEGDGADGKPKSKEGAREAKSTEDLGTFKKQLLKLQEVVRLASGSGGGARRGYGRGAGSAEGDQGSGRDRTRGRRGASWRDRVPPPDQPGVQGRDEEGDAARDNGPPPPDRSRRGRRPPPPDDRGPDAGDRQDDRGPGGER